MLTLMLDGSTLEHHRICGLIVTEISSHIHIPIFKLPQIAHSLQFPNKSQFDWCFSSYFPILTMVNGRMFLFPFYGHCSNNIFIFANSTNSWTVFPVFSQRISISWLFYRFFPWKPMKISHQQIRFSLTFHKKVHRNHINHMKEPRFLGSLVSPQKTTGRCRRFSGLYPSCRRRRKWATAGARSAGTAGTGKMGFILGDENYEWFIGWFK
jgi:hypothetical protein